MPPSPENSEQKLEQIIQQTLRDLPARTAPRSLEHCVLAELERRAALPWWHKSYAYWPAPVRAGFFFASAAAAVLVIVSLFALTGGAIDADATGEFMAQFAVVRDWLGTVAEKPLMIVRAIPPLWLYGAVALVVSCYVTVIGIGVAAYRTLRNQRSL